jgi:hypothetical protein
VESAAAVCAALRAPAGSALREAVLGHGARARAGGAAAAALLHGAYAGAAAASELSAHAAPLPRLARALAARVAADARGDGGALRALAARARAREPGLALAALAARLDADWRARGGAGAAWPFARGAHALQTARLLLDAVAAQAADDSAPRPLWQKRVAALLAALSVAATLPPPARALLRPALAAALRSPGDASGGGGAGGGLSGGWALAPRGPHAPPAHGGAPAPPRAGAALAAYVASLTAALRDARDAPVDGLRWAAGAAGGDDGLRDLLRAAGAALKADAALRARFDGLPLLAGAGGARALAALLAAARETAAAKTAELAPLGAALFPGSAWEAAAHAALTRAVAGAARASEDASLVPVRSLLTEAGTLADAAWPAHRVLVEYDGSAAHGAPGAGLRAGGAAVGARLLAHLSAQLCEALRRCLPPPDATPRHWRPAPAALAAAAALTLDVPLAAVAPAPAPAGSAALPVAAFAGAASVDRWLVRLAAYRASAAARDRPPPPPPLCALCHAPWRALPLPAGAAGGAAAAAAPGADAATSGVLDEAGDGDGDDAGAPALAPLHACARDCAFFFNAHEAERLAEALRALAARHGAPRAPPPSANTTLRNDVHAAAGWRAVVVTSDEFAAWTQPLGGAARGHHARALPTPARIELLRRLADAGLPVDPA